MKFWWFLHKSHLLILLGGIPLNPIQIFVMHGFFLWVAPTPPPTLPEHQKIILKIEKNLGTSPTLFLQKSRCSFHLQESEKVKYKFLCLYFPHERDSVTGFLLKVFFMNHLPRPSSLDANSKFIAGIITAGVNTTGPTFHRDLH